MGRDKLVLGLRFALEQGRGAYSGIAVEDGQLSDWLSDWLALPQNIEKMRQAGVSVAEAAITSALGKLEMDLVPRIVGPVLVEVGKFRDESLIKLDLFVTQQLKKIRLG